MQKPIDLSTVMSSLNQPMNHDNQSTDNLNEALGATTQLFKVFSDVIAAHLPEVQARGEPITSDLIMGVLLNNFPPLAPCSANRVTGPPNGVRSAKRNTTTTKDTGPASDPEHRVQLQLATGFTGRTVKESLYYPTVIGHCCSRITRGENKNKQCPKEVDIQANNPINRIFCTACAKKPTKRTQFENLEASYGNDFNKFYQEARQWLDSVNDGTINSANTAASSNSTQDDAPEFRVDLWPPGTSRDEAAFYIDPNHNVLLIKDIVQAFAVVNTETGELYPLDSELKQYYSNHPVTQIGNFPLPKHWAQLNEDGSIKGQDSNQSPSVGSTSNVINQDATPPVTAVAHQVSPPHQDSSSSSQQSNQMSGSVPTQPSNSMPPNQQSNQMSGSVPTQPSNSMPPNQPSNSMAPTQPSNSIPPNQPSNSMAPNQPSNSMAPNQPSNSMPPNRVPAPPQSSNSMPPNRVPAPPQSSNSMPPNRVPAPLQSSNSMPPNRVPAPPQSSNSMPPNRVPGQVPTNPSSNYGQSVGSNNITAPIPSRINQSSVPTSATPVQ